tara:strand:- start:2293 stop:2460 length:168 start_codon:yes stop_codon:yes gene_type:complete
MKIRDWDDYDEIEERTALEKSRSKTKKKKKEVDNNEKEKRNKKTGKLWSNKSSRV